MSSFSFSRIYSMGLFQFQLRVLHFCLHRIFTTEPVSWPIGDLDQISKGIGDLDQLKVTYSKLVISATQRTNKQLKCKQSVTGRLDNYLGQSKCICYSQSFVTKLVLLLIDGKLTIRLRMSFFGHTCLGV